MNKVQENKKFNVMKARKFLFQNDNWKWSKLIINYLFLEREHIFILIQTLCDVIFGIIVFNYIEQQKKHFYQAHKKNPNH